MLSPGMFRYTIFVACSLVPRGTASPSRSLGSSATMVMQGSCPRYFVPVQAPQSDSRSDRNEGILCRYQGPYPMGKEGMESWQEVPEVPLLREGIPLSLIRLGESFFFDQSLSLNRNLSCATCHQPERAFTDQKILASTPETGELFRHTPSLINTVFQKRFFLGWT